MEADLRTYIIGQASISAVISTRMFLLNAPQGATRPLVVYRLMGSQPHKLIRNYCGLTTDTFEIDCQSYTDTGAMALKELIRTKLDTYRGTMGSTWVSSCNMTDESNDYTTDQAGRDKGVYHCLMEFEITHSETVPSV